MYSIVVGVVSFLLGVLYVRYRMPMASTTTKTAEAPPAPPHPRQRWDVERIREMLQRLLWGTQLADRKLARAVDTLNGAKNSTVQCPELHTPDTVAQIEAAQTQTDSARNTLAYVTVGTDSLVRQVDDVADAAAHPSTSHPPVA